MNIDNMYALLDKWFDEGKQGTEEYNELEEAVNLAENQAKYKQYEEEEEALWTRRWDREDNEDFVYNEIKGMKEEDTFFDPVFEAKFVESYYANLT